MVDEDQLGVKWWAFLAPSAEASPVSGFVLVPHYAARVLEAPVRLGEVTLRPAERQLIEYVHTAPAGGWEEVVSWPVIAEGSSNAQPRAALHGIVVRD